MYQITDCGVFRVNIPDVTVVEGLGDDLIYMDTGLTLAMNRSFITT
jgi:hypothetical protein